MVLVLIASGCTQEPSPSTSTSADTAPAPPRFAEIRDEILLPTCATAECHGGTGAGGLQLAADTAWVNLVGVPSAAVPEETLVVPGDPDRSYLLMKLAGVGIAGDPMPPQGPLEEAVVGRIRAWIAAGAADD